jgi:rod shape-determining protein MreC
MLTRERSDRALPTFITLLVVGILLMTFDVRLEGGGVVGVLRTGTQAVVAPLQKGANVVIRPVVDMVDSLANITSLREENAVLAAELAESQADLVAVQDQLARLELLEQLYDLEVSEETLGQTVANVIGQPDFLDAALIIDKGTREGVNRGQPVIDTNGYVVGTISSASLSSATVIPITADRQGIVVLVGSQVGTVTSQVLTSEMRLEIFDAREPILTGDRVVTSAVSTSYPAGLPVGTVVSDKSPQGTSLIGSVEPFVEADKLRLVVVLAWPPDPVSAATVDTLPFEEITTTTTVPSETTTTAAE